MAEEAGDMIVEQGTYNLIASTDGDFKITHIVLKGPEKKRVWKIKTLTEKEIHCEIEKF